MRTEPQIRAMHDHLFVRWATHTETAVDELRAALGWVLDPSASDSVLLDLIELTGEVEEYEPRLEDLAVALIDAISPTTLPATEESLSRMASAQLTELAAAARKLDRLCKAELKGRNTPK